MDKILSLKDGFSVALTWQNLLFALIGAALGTIMGTLLFTKNPDVVWGLIAALLIGNIMLLVMNIPLVSLFARVLLIPPRFLMPIVAMTISDGDWSILVASPLSIILWAVAVVGFVTPIIFGRKLRRGITDSASHTSA